MIQPRFTAIVRTCGDRLDSLAESLLSLALQPHPTTAIVVVHAGTEAYERILRAHTQTHITNPQLSIQVLHAPQTGRYRGYPANVALDHYRTLRHSDLDYFFFLDDDDVVYPFFTTAMAQAFLTTEADVVYGGAKCREDGRKISSHWPGHVLEMFHENFIPINSFAIRGATWRKHPVYFDEDYEYLEDWKFLLNLAERQYRFAATARFVAEFHIDSRRRRMEASSPRWQRDLAEIRKYIRSTSFPLPGGQLATAILHRAPVPEALPEITMSATDRKLTALQQRVSDLENSLSWRITLPLRMMWSFVLALTAAHKRGGH